MLEQFWSHAQHFSYLDTLHRNKIHHTMVPLVLSSIVYEFRCQFLTEKNGKLAEKKRNVILRNLILERNLVNSEIGAILNMNRKC